MVAIDSRLSPPLAWKVTKQKTAATASVTHHRPCSTPRLDRAGAGRGRAPAGGADEGARTPSVGGGSVGAAGTDTFAQCAAHDCEQAGE